MILPSGMLAWLNKTYPEAGFIDDNDVIDYFNGEEDGEDLLDSLIESYKSDNSDQLATDREEVDSFVDTDDYDIDDDIDLDDDTDGDGDGTHYVEEVDVNGDGDTDIVEVCTDGDGESEVVATKADDPSEAKKVDEHLELDEARETFRNIANTLGERRW